MRAGNFHPRIVLSAAVCIAGVLALLCGDFPATAQPSDDGKTIADAVLAELEAANRARSALAAERAEWAAERERLAVLKAGLAHELATWRQQARTTEAAIADVRGKLEAATDARATHELVADELAAHAAAIHAALDRFSAMTFPGVVPVRPENSATHREPVAAFSAAMERLRNAEHHANSFAVELVSGTLDGSAIAVKLLRLGAVAAWWVSMDGAMAGVAAMRDGRLVLARVTAESDADAIRKAVAVADGQRVPEWLSLPFAKTEMRDEGATHGEIGGGHGR